jgi:hypothetical protein
MISRLYKILGSFHLARQIMASDNIFKPEMVTAAKKA